MLQRQSNFLSHQFQINQRLCILRHAYLHKNIQLPTNFLNNNKALINFLSFVYSINHKRFDISFFKFMILRTLATVAKHIEIISYHLRRHFVIYMYDLNLLELLVTGNPAGNKCFIYFVDVWCAKMSNMTKITYCS